jgi:hypothetical protein
VRQQGNNTVNRAVARARAVILFPALLTPLVHVESDAEQWFELLIATDHDDESALPAIVNRQLKVSAELDPTKAYDDVPLFGGVCSAQISVIEVGQTKNAGKEILKTRAKFEGILHPAVGDVLSAKGLAHVYAVRVHKSCLRAKPNAPRLLRSSAGERPLDKDPTRLPAKEFATVGGELSDELIREMLDERLGKDDGSFRTKAGRIPGRCRYAFPLSGSTVDLSRFDRFEPVPSYHPLFVFTPDEFAYASIGHLSDLHVNCRWQILAKSPARVIEYPDDEHAQESPPIGQLVAETNRSVHDVMAAVFDSNANLVVIGGDLIDHIRNAYDPVLARAGRQATVTDVWKAVDLDKGFTEQSYPYGIDLVAFYSLVLAVIRKSTKPAFAISGNHDCYVDPFGISPRVRTTRANEGIPADLNLTFYEALLAFGPTGGLLTKLGSSFDKDWFEWFYLVFSPFNDWCHKLPRQSLVGLGWGTAEAIVDAWGDQSRGEQHEGLLPDGHLPRSTDGVSDRQLELLQHAVAQAEHHKVTLTTHFTFLSYKEDVPVWTANRTPTPGVLDSGYKNKFGYGTFEKNRETVLGMLNQGQIQCVLTGHSHRRGTYLLRRNEAQNALMFDAGGEGLAVADALQHGVEPAPAIVVSDSAGPYPRNTGTASSSAGEAIARAARS